MKKILIFIFLFLIVSTLYGAGIKTWIPKPVTFGDYRVQIGYNEPGEMGTDARDLRIFDNNNNVIASEIGRIIFFGENENNSYATPSNFPMYSEKIGDKTLWTWDYIDNRSGIYQNNKVIIEENNVTAYLGVKFLKDTKGQMLFSVIAPNENGVYTDVNNKIKMGEWTVGDKKYIFTLQGDGEFSFGHDSWGFNHLIRRLASYDSIKLNGNFKAGEERTFVLNINLEGKKVFPKYENLNFDKTYSMIQADIKDGKAFVPFVPETLAFMPKDKKEIAVSLFNFGSKNANYPVEVIVKDYNNKTVLKAKNTLKLKGNSEDYAIFDMSKLPFGLYSATFSCKSGEGKEIYRRFAILRDPVEITAKESMFGLQSFNFYNNTDYLDFVSKIGCHFLRVGHNGVWDGGNPDATWESYKKHGIDYCYTLQPYDYDTVDTQNIGYGIYEIFNEPDAEMKYPEYVDKYKKFYDKIKSAHPEARIMGPNVSGGDIDSGSPLVKGFIKSGVDYDYLSIHPYSCARVIGEGLEPFSPEKNSIYEKLSDIASISKNPVILGEYGFTMLCQHRFPETNFGQYEKQYAHYMARSFLLAKMVPNVEKIVHFFLSPEKLGLITREPAQYGPYSMVGAENNPEPMLAAYATLANSIDGSKFVEKLEFENAPNVWGLVTERKGEYFVAIWAASGKYNLKFQKLNNAIHRSFVGTDEEYNKNVISVTGEPFYIITKDYTNIEKIKNGIIEKIVVKKKSKNIDYSKLEITWDTKHNSNPIVIDGDLSEWDDLPIILNQQTQIMPPDPGVWKGPEDLSARIGSKYDDDYLYIACEVTDNYHKNTSEAPALWQEDSLQITLANLESPYNNVEMNVGVSDKTDPIVIPIVGRTKPLDKMKCAVKRVDNKTIYEFALAFSDFPDITMGKGEYCRFALCINDKDELGIRRWTSVKNPSFIAGIKEPNDYPVVCFR